jgi:hypothetical protein
MPAKRQSAHAASAPVIERGRARVLPFDPIPYREERTPPMLQNLKRRRSRRATLPWDELEAEAARQGCSPADIFFDRAGLGAPEAELLEPEAEAPEEEAAEEREYVPWRGLDPRPRA